MYLKEVEHNLTRILTTRYTTQKQFDLCMEELKEHFVAINKDYLISLYTKSMAEKLSVTEREVKVPPKIYNKLKKMLEGSKLTKVTKNYFRFVISSGNLKRYSSYLYDYSFINIEKTQMISSAYYYFT